MTVWALVFILSLGNVTYVKKIVYESPDECRLYQLLGHERLKKTPEVGGKSFCEAIPRI